MTASSLYTYSTLDVLMPVAQNLVDGVSQYFGLFAILLIAGPHLDDSGKVSVHRYDSIY